MTTSVPSKDPNQPAAEKPSHPADSFSERLQLFWAKNSSAVTTGCTLVLLGILAKGGWEMYVDHRETSVGKAFGSATTAEQIRQFISSHPGHALAGVAHLRLADEDYTAGKYAEAAVNYGKAIAPLADLPMTARAKLGLAMSRLLSGKTAEGLADLKKISDDAGTFKALRAEACYHLVSQAVGEGKSAEVNSLIEKLLQIDGSSMWAQRAMMLRAQMPATAEPASAPAPAAGEVKLSIPGKK